MTLENIRHEIYRIDRAIIALLAERSDYVLEAGKQKKDRDGVRDPGRVEQVIDKVKSMASEAGLDPAIAEAVYRTMIGCFIDQELRGFAAARQASSTGRP